MRGFTLIEMVVVVAVILIGLGLLAPNLAATYANRRLNSAGDLIIRKLNLARQNAISEKRDWYVVFFRRGVQLARENRETGKIDYIESMEKFEAGDTEQVSYKLGFAGSEGFGPREIPVAAVNADHVTDERLDAITEGDDSNVIRRAGDIFICFRPDGSVDFGRNNDVPTQDFEEGRRADIQIRQNGLLDRQGWIDLKPTGRPVFKLQPIEGSEHDF